MAFADAAKGGVAAHLAERLDALRQQQGAPAHPRGGERSLGSGVTATDDDDFESACSVHIRVAILFNRLRFAICGVRVLKDPVT
jgi:hypothetical protein